MQNCFGKFDATSFQEIILSSGVFRRETASGFYPWGNVEGPRERVAEGLCVGGMETRFQWRKAHSRTAKCEAFHIAPRLFFMFLFLISLTIRQHCIIYPQEFSTEPVFVQWNMPGMSLRYVGLLDSMSRFFFGVVAFGNLLRCGTVSLI